MKAYIVLSSTFFPDLGAVLLMIPSLKKLHEMFVLQRRLLLLAMKVHIVIKVWKPELF